MFCADDDEKRKEKKGDGGYGMWFVFVFLFLWRNSDFTLYKLLQCVPETRIYEATSEF